MRIDLRFFRTQDLRFDFFEDLLALELRISAESKIKLFLKTLKLPEKLKKFVISLPGNDIQDLEECDLSQIFGNLQYLEHFKIKLEQISLLSKILSCINDRILSFVLKFSCENTVNSSKVEHFVSSLERFKDLNNLELKTSFEVISNSQSSFLHLETLHIRV